MSTPATTIRPATVADLPEIARLIRVLNTEEGYDISAPVEALEEVLFSKHAQVPMRALIAEAQRKPVGLALYYWGYDTVSATYGYHLADIVVDPSLRGQGVGVQLFNTLAQQCLEESGQWISLTVLKQNDRAQRFYRKRGMVEVAVNFFAIGPQGLARCT